MSRRLDQPGHVDVVVITFTDPENLTMYRLENELDVPIVSDSERAAYRLFGLRRGKVRRVWGLQAAKRYVEIIRTDGFSGLARPTEDSLQLGGDFIVDSNGVLIYGYWSEGPDDRPSVDNLAKALKSGRRQ